MFALDQYDIIREPAVWLLCAVTVSLVAVQAVLFCRLARRAARDVSLEPAAVKRAFRTGVISSVGPTVGVIIVMVGLMSSMGAPMTWMRLSIVGNAATELVGATCGAEAAGTTIGGEGFTLKVMVLCWLVMALNGLGWLTFTTLFTPSLDRARNFLAGGDSKWLALISTACTVGIFSYLCANASVDATFTVHGGQVCACIAGGVSMFVMGKWLVPKWPKLGQFSLGIAMVIGIAAGMLCDRFTSMLGGAL